MLTTLARQELSGISGGRVRFDEPLRLHTSFRIGGPAEAWVEPQDIEELNTVLSFAQAADVPVTMIGGGANLLVRDAGIPGVVVSLSALVFRRLTRDGTAVTVGAGVGLDRIVAMTRDAGLGGCEFLTGIPGKLGGAVCMNAGTRDGEGGFRAMSDVVTWVTVLRRTGAMSVLSAADVGFQYRCSGLNGDVILEATLQLIPRPSEEIARNIAALMAYKRATQDLSAPSAGCIFKNPRGGPTHLPDEHPSAGWLIDRAGLKGLRVGNAMVSPRHANFIVNLGSAKASDVLALISAIQYKVLQEHGLFLDLEVQVLPA